MNPWIVGACAYLVTLAVILVWNHGAHRNPTPKPETRVSSEANTTDAAS